MLVFQNMLVIMYQPCDNMIISSQALFYQWLLMILFNCNTSPENDLVFRIIHCILTLIPNWLLGRTLVRAHKPVEEVALLFLNPQ